MKGGKYLQPPMSTHKDDLCEAAKLGAGGRLFFQLVAELFGFVLQCRRQEGQRDGHLIIGELAHRASRQDFDAGLRQGGDLY